MIRYHHALNNVAHSDEDDDDELSSHKKGSTIRRLHRTLFEFSQQRPAICLLLLCVVALLGIVGAVVLAQSVLHASRHSSSASSFAIENADDVNSRRPFRPESPGVRGAARYFWYRNESFVVNLGDGNGERETLLLSGSLHYFRMHPSTWSDRLRKLKACGMNAVDTYVPWNWHEPQAGLVRFDGQRDLDRFIALAAAEGLFVLIRPGKSVCEREK